MEYIPMILSGLALLAATVCLTITLREKKRNQKRNVDLANLIKVECNVVKGEITLSVDEALKNIQEAHKTVYSGIELKLLDHAAKIDNLEKGIVPDYAEALAAKNSVDEFNRGLSAIMGFDPMAVAKKAREERQYGGEVD